MAMLLPGVANAQFFNGSGIDSANALKPWMDFKLSTKSRVKLDFRDAGVDSVIAFYEKATGVTIVKDPTLTGKMTITSAKQVTLNDAFAILKANLDLKGFDLTKEGNFLEIKNRNQGNFGGGGRNNFPIDFGNTGGLDQANVSAKVYPIVFANAAQLAKVVNDVYSGNTLNPGANPFGGFGGGRPGGGGNPFGGGRPGGGANPFGGGGGNQFRNMFAGLGQNQTQVKASSDDYTNSVVVTASDRDQLQVGTLIKQLDKNADEPMKPHVYTLKYASVNDVQPVVANVLTTNAPRGRAGAGPQTTQSAFTSILQRAGNGNAPQGPVVSDTRTNSLIVTTTPANQEIVAKLVEQLDQAVVFQSTTFVVPLKNATASNVANLFLQAFGQRQGANSSSTQRNQFGQANQSANSQVNTRTTNGGGGGGARGGGASVGPGDDSIAQTSLPIALDPNSSNGSGGDLLTSVGVTQGFFGGGGGQRPGGAGGQSSTQTSVVQTRDSSGQIVNLRDLSQSITVIPDPNTNQLIVVTTPDNKDLVMSIIDKLDQIPQQVMIQTIIVEASISKVNQFGWEWTFANKNNKATQAFGLQNANPPLTGLSYTLTSGDLTAFFNMLQTDTKFQVLSTPRIFTSNNTQAQINISQSIPYIVSTIENTNGTESFNYAFQDVGIVLTVTPRITSNGYVNMDVTQTANDLQGYTSFNAPIVNQREADTTVSVKDGQTVVLGGIIQNQVQATVNKVPLLGDIPILGNLFKSTSRTDSKTELLVFLTPRVVTDPAEAKKIYDETTKSMGADTRKDMSEVLPKGGGTTPPPAKKGGN